MSSEKTSLYLCALLEYIPAKTARDIYDSILNKANATFKECLKIADKYVLTSNGKIKDQPFHPFLTSPFEFLGAAVSNQAPKYKLSALPLNISHRSLPVRATNPESENVKKLWQQFDGAFSMMINEVKELSEVCKATENLLQKYTVNISNPSDLNQEISWYDFARIKAGLAICLQDYFQEEGRPESRIEDEARPLRIIRADISGIQQFLYDIVSKQASKNLKGRSFYVHLLADAVKRKLVERLHLFAGNIIYASGGNFFLIAPNTDFVRRELVHFEKYIGKHIFETHQGRIAVVLGSTSVSQSEIISGKINKTISRLFREVIDQNKKRKFSEYISEHYEYFFTPSGQGGDVVIDSITGEEINIHKDRFYEVVENEVLPVLHHPGTLSNGPEENLTNLISLQTGKQILLGHWLKDACCILVGNNFPEQANTVSPCNLGISYQVLRKQDLHRREVVGDVEEVLVLNDENITEVIPPSWKYKQVVYFYGGHASPLLTEEDINEVKTGHPEGTIAQDGIERKVGDAKQFSDLALGGGNFKRLAVLRMDLDGLGDIFKNISSTNLSFPYYASLSRNLDWFFRGYINTIWREHKEFRQFCQIIYSGGDDLMIIGRWDAIIAFAETIKKEFYRYTCESEVLTISGGVSIVTDKFPIMKAADLAARAEKAAKDHELYSIEPEKTAGFVKNSITLLGMPLHWNSEYQLVKELKEELVELISPEDGKGGLPKGLLSRIQNYGENAKKYEQIKRRSQYGKSTEKVPPPRWIWQIAYDFTRLEKLEKKKRKAYMQKLRAGVEVNMNSYLESRIAALSGIKQQVFTNQWVKNKDINSRYHFVELLSLAARWAELELRTKND